MKGEEIIVYTTSTCRHCHDLIKWLKENNIPHLQKDVVNEKNKEEFVALDGKGFPLTIISGEKKKNIILGFNERKLTEALLGINYE